MKSIGLKQGGKIMVSMMKSQQKEYMKVAEIIHINTKVKPYLIIAIIEILQ